MTESASNPLQDEKAIELHEHRFNRVSWRLALRLELADRIETVRRLLKRTISTRVLRHDVSLDDDPMVQPLGKRMHRDITENYIGDVTESLSIFGMINITVANPDGSTPPQSIDFNGLSVDLHSRPVSKRYLDHFGQAAVEDANLSTIELLLKRTVGMGERRQPGAEWVINETKRRELEALGMVEPRPNGLSQHIYGRLASSIADKRNETRES